MLWHPKATRNSAVSQTDRATLCVIEYFAKSLKVTQEHSKWHRWVRYKLLFHCNYVCISYRFCDIQRQRMAWLWNWGLGVGVVQGHWKWRHSIDYIRLVGNRKYSSILYHFRVIWRRIIPWPWNLAKRSLEVIWKWYDFKAWVRFPIRLP